jgi:hypothetical protein
VRVVQRLFLFIFIYAALTAVAGAQNPLPAGNLQGKASTTYTGSEPQEVGESDVVRITTSLVKVPVSVRDRQGRYISDLKKEDFKVYENGVEQQIAHFGDVEEPISVVLLIDVSCSIAKPRDSIEAALAFIDQLRPADSVLPIAFGKDITPLLTASTRDHTILRERVLSLTPDGMTVPCDCDTRPKRLGDALEFVIDHILKKGTGRRAVILLSDGNETGRSKRGWQARVLRAVSELGVPFEQIGEELRHQYMLAYYPNSSPGKSERRKIKVRVNKEKIGVRARESYVYSPSAR